MARRLTSRDTNWKTIDQRERERATYSRRKKKAYGYGATAATSLATYYTIDPWKVSAAAKIPREMRLLDRTNRIMGNGFGTRFASQGRYLANKPFGQKLAVGLGVGGVGALGIGGIYSAREKHAQTKINERRKANYARSRSRSVAVGKSAKWGAGSSQGRKYVELEVVEKRRREIDPEAARQRRLGGYITAAGIGGAALGVRGGRGVRVLRSGKYNAHLIARGSDVAQMAGGAGLLEASRRMHRRGASERNDRWR